MLSNIYSLSDLRKIEHEAEKLNLPLMQRAAQAACPLPGGVGARHRTAGDFP